MTPDDFIEYVERRTYPFSFKETGRANLSRLFRTYPESFLLECVDIGIEQYFQYDDDGKLTQDSVEEFLHKLGGIAYNKSQSLVNQEMRYIRNWCNKVYPYWNDVEGRNILLNYVSALRKAGYTDSQVLTDLQNEVNKLCNSCHNWSQWRERMQGWIDDISHWGDPDTTTIKEDGTILPAELFDGLSPNLRSLCQQINASYENNLYDCTAVIMRRLLEGLLVLSYQHHKIEDEITGKNGQRFFLDKIIGNAQNNATLALSKNTRKDMPLFKDIGNYSAHKIWYNALQQDIKPHILKYRAIIEELLYKAGLK